MSRRINITNVISFDKIVLGYSFATHLLVKFFSISYTIL